MTSDAMTKQVNQITSQPGAAPGIEHDEIVGLPGGTGQVLIACTDYSPAQVLIQAVDDLDEFLGRHRPEWSAVRWISVAGLSDMNAIHALATKYDLHPLAIEDLLHSGHRPKVESYGGEDSELLARLFIVTRVLQIKDGRLQHEQVSIFVGHHTVLTFQAARGEVWELICQRIKVKGSRLRNNAASFLAYSLLDAVVDSSFPILEYYSDRAEELETMILERARPNLISEIHQLKRDLLLLHRAIWPMRKVVATLQRDLHECLSDTTRVYLRDLYDHVTQIIDIIETYREIATDLTDLLDRSTEWELIPACQNEGLGVIPWSPLRGGWLSGKFRRGMTAPPDDTRVKQAEEMGWSESWSAYNTERTWSVLDELFAVADETSKSPAQVALNWLLQRPGVTAPIIGARNMEQLDRNLGASG
jgi:magnesium transporter